MAREMKINRRGDVTFAEKRNHDLDLAITNFEATDSVADAIEMVRIARDLYAALTMDLRTYLGYVNDAIDAEERNRMYPRDPVSA